MLVGASNRSDDQRAQRGFVPLLPQPIGIVTDFLLVCMRFLLLRGMSSHKLSAECRLRGVWLIGDLRKDL